MGNPDHNIRVQGKAVRWDKNKVKPGDEAKTSY